MCPCLHLHPVTLYLLYLTSSYASSFTQHTPAPSNALLALLNSYASSFTVSAAAEVDVMSLPPPAPSKARSVKQVKLEA
jgi:hypothetical protein